MFFTIRMQTIIASCIAVLITAGLLLLVFGALAYEPVSTTVSAEAEAGTVLVIDAGHGGEDGGAQSADGLLESAVNLDIALRMEALAAFCGVETAMTRESASIDYPVEAETVRARKVADQKARVALVNSFENAVLISIHQNNYPASQPRGPQVLYAATEGSQALGELTHANLNAALYPENRRVAAPISDSIYLTKMVTCPAILVECGFLSNPEEAALLASDAYRTQLAVILLGSYLQYMSDISG